MEGLFDYGIVVENRGKCCPFFCGNFFLLSIFQIAGPKKGETLPIFVGEFFFDFPNCGSTEGEMLPIFLGELFLLFDSRLWVQIRGKFCPFFWVYFLLLLDLSVFEMLTILQ